jgi:hypothetical protein
MKIGFVKLISIALSFDLISKHLPTKEISNLK